jgi:SAM-dependent methyltransferase
MQALDRFFAAQLGQPHGAFGRLAMGPILKWGNASLNAWTSSLLDIQAADRVLDLGCGPGAALAANARRTAAGFAVGLDYAAAMIQQARRRNAALVRQGRAGLARGDAAALPFADQSFTVVYAVNVIYFWPDAAGALQEIRRVLCHGGKVAIATRPRARIERLAFTRYGLRLYGDDELARLLRAAGFTAVRSVLQPVRGGMGGLATLGERP